MDEDLLNQAEAETNRDKRLVRQAEDEMRGDKAQILKSNPYHDCMYQFLRALCFQQTKILRHSSRLRGSPRKGGTQGAAAAVSAPKTATPLRTSTAHL
jgi:hypothetical protein